MSWWMIHLLAFGSAFGMVMVLIGVDHGLRYLEHRWKQSQKQPVGPQPAAQIRRLVRPVTRAPSMCSQLVHVREAWHAR